MQRGPGIFAGLLGGVIRPRLGARKASAGKEPFEAVIFAKLRAASDALLTRISLGKYRLQEEAAVAVWIAVTEADDDIEVIEPASLPYGSIKLAAMVRTRGQAHV